MRRERALLGVDLLCVASVLVIVLWSLHPNYLFSTSLITGGDTGAHLMLPAFLRSHNSVLNLTPWFPGWFAGMPAYTYYFVLPDYLAVLASYVIPFAVAFKLATVLGSLLLPVSAYVMGRLFRARRPIPVALAMATLPFLFDASFTIDGGNLFSTLAGEYAFSLSLALSLLAIGLFARGVRTGRGYVAAALCLSATLAAHLLPWLFALVIIAVVAVMELTGLSRPNEPSENAGPTRPRPVRFVLGATLLSLALSAWWLGPFATSQSLTNSMGYTNDDVSSLHAVFTTLGWFTSSGGAAGDRWVLVGAGLSAIYALVRRSRLGLLLTFWCALSFLAFVLDPQSAIWNERLIPFWYLGTHLLLGWAVGEMAYRYTSRGEKRDAAVFLDLVEAHGRDETRRFTHEERDSWLEWLAQRAHVRLVNVTAGVALVGLLSTVPGLLPPVASALHLNTTGNQVSNWAAWNYSGYQGRSAWPEYHHLMTTMDEIGHHDGCGRAMWEYNANENRFGTTMALMLLPYWTHGCVGSMEGLFFESSPTAPYHFLDQAELSSDPSDPQVGLDYSGLNVALGVTHLQMLGVRYYLAFSSAAVAEANADPDLTLLTRTPAFASHVRWSIYEVRRSPLVQAWTHTPVVVPHLESRLAWLGANQTWWLNPRDFAQPLAMSGPASWPRAASVAHLPATATLPSVRVSDVHQTTQSLSFHVSRTGVPIEVKISYFSRWRVDGALGPFRTSPDLMTVVPTSRQVTLVYATPTSQLLGEWLSGLTALALALWAARQWRRRRRARREAASPSR